MWSGWGVVNLKSRVISKNPDTVFIEFAINDAQPLYRTSVEDARLNLTNMINRVLLYNPDTEIILMTMNLPVWEYRKQTPVTGEYYQMYRDVAKERNLPLIDHALNWQNLVQNDIKLFMKYVPDGVHPGKEGCLNVITPAILKSLGIQTGLNATQVLHHPAIQSPARPDQDATGREIP